MGEWRETGESFYTADGTFGTQAYVRMIRRRMEFREIERLVFAEGGARDSG